MNEFSDAEQKFVDIVYKSLADIGLTENQIGKKIKTTLRWMKKNNIGIPKHKKNKKKKPCTKAMHDCDQQQAEGSDICMKCGWRADKHYRKESQK